MSRYTLADVRASLESGGLFDQSAGWRLGIVLRPDPGGGTPRTGRRIEIIRGLVLGADQGMP